MLFTRLSCVARHVVTLPSRVWSNESRPMTFGIPFIRSGTNGEHQKNPQRLSPQ